MKTLSANVCSLGRRPVLIGILLLVSAAPGRAQVGTARAAPLFYWGVDVATATLSGLVQGRVAKAPAVRALLGGLLGGSAMYVGQRLVGTGEPALRFGGLQVVAAGASVARNLALGHTALNELTFPVFPLYLRLRPGSRPPVSVRLSLVAIGGIVHTVREFHVGPDWRESLIAGMPVFAVAGSRLGACADYERGGCITRVMGHHVVGAVVYATHPSPLTAQSVLTHELGHAAQDMRDLVLHALPASDYVLSRVAAGRWISRFLVIDLALPLDLASRAAGPPSDPACRGLPSFYECETEAMMGPP